MSVSLKYVLVDAPSCQSLSAVTLQLLQFSEEAFGRHATSPALTKLPVSLPLHPEHVLVFVYYNYLINSFIHYNFCILVMI